MFINIEKKLHQEKHVQESFASGNSTIKDVQKLLDDGQQEDLKLLRGLSDHSTLVQAENLKGKKLEIESKEKFYKGKVFTKDVILKLAVKYRLKFLPSTLFCGEFDTSIIAELKEFERGLQQSYIDSQESKRSENQMSKRTSTWELDESELKQNFFILAPSKCFKLNPKNIARLMEIQIDDDPILFYKIDDNHYRIIKKWGSDFTIFRRALGWLTAGSTERYKFFGLILPVWSLLFTIYYLWHKISTTATFWIISSVSFAVISILMLCIFFDEDAFGYNYTESTDRYSIFKESEEERRERKRKEEILKRGY
jgi:hypothetical protein